MAGSPDFGSRYMVVERPTIQEVRRASAGHFEKGRAAAYADSLGLPFGTAFPQGRVTMKMADAEDNDAGCFNTVEDTEGKSMNDRTTNVTVNDLVLERRLGYPVEDRIQFGEELAPKSGPLQLVPPCGRPNVDLCRSPDNQPAVHSLRRISLRT